MYYILWILIISSTVTINAIKKSVFSHSYLTGAETTNEEKQLFEISSIYIGAIPRIVELVFGFKRFLMCFKEVQCRLACIWHAWKKWYCNKLYSEFCIFVFFFIWMKKEKYCNWVFFSGRPTTCPTVRSTDATGRI